MFGLRPRPVRSSVIVAGRRANGAAATRWEIGRAGKAEDADEVAEEDFLRACARLACFDYCGVVEQGLEPLARHLGWTAHGIHENRSGSVLGLIQDFRRRHFSGLKDRIANPKRPPDAAFCADFDRSNPWDLRLYDMVKVAQEGADR
jgi:hypothetical protein